MAHATANSPSNALIQQGRALHGQGKLREALKKFTLAMGKCPCNKGSRRPRCACKDFAKAASEDRSLFDEAMYHCSCEVGKKYQKCNEASHLLALSYRAATFESLKELERAKKDAEWILELAPRQPEGYLRLGKIARLQREHEYAWKIYCAGVDATDNDHSTSKARQLRAEKQSLALRYVKKDPMTLPPEIVYGIFSQFSTVELCRCLSVSRTWKCVLTAPVHQRLWYRLVIPTLPLKLQTSFANIMRRLASYSGQNARSLKLTLPERLRYAFLEHIEKHLPGLQILSLQTLRLDQLFLGTTPATGKKPRWPKLTTLRLAGSLYDPEMGSLPIDAQETVENLHLQRLRVSSVAGLPSSVLVNMPRLRYLRLDDIIERTGTWFPHISDAAPALEQLWLHENPTTPVQRLPIPPPPTPNSGLWSNLRVFIRTGECHNTAAGHLLLAFMLGCATTAQEGKNIEHVRISFPRQYEELPLSTDAPSPLIHIVEGEDFPLQFSDTIEYSGMRSLQLENLVMDPKKLGVNLAPAIQAGRLHTLDIVFSHSRIGDWAGNSSRATLEAYSLWLAGCESITELGIFDFLFTIDDHPKLAQFLATFPNLVTLKIGSNQQDALSQCSIIEGIVKATKLQAVYQTEVKGANLDRLVALGKQHGTRIAYGLPEQVWPVPLD